MRPPQQAEEERHDGVGDLLCPRGVNVNEAEAEVGGKGGVDGAVCGAKAEDDLIRAEAPLGGAWEVREGVQDNGSGRLNLPICQAAEGNVLDAGDAGQ